MEYLSQGHEFLWKGFLGAACSSRTSEKDAQEAHPARTENRSLWCRSGGFPEDSGTLNGLNRKPISLLVRTRVPPQQISNL